MTEPRYLLRYVPDSRYGDQYPNLRYPMSGPVPKRTAELMRAAMPRPDDFELVACDEEGD